jgi:predicted nucleic acid-binding protein
VKGIADTGFLVAFANRRDLHHEWAVEVARRVAAPFVTCEAVLAETAFHLESVSYVLSLVKQGLVQIAFDLSQNVEQLDALARRYHDRRPDLADLCLIRMSEIYPHHVVVTTDQSDFRVYRRNKRDVIPRLTPDR